MGNGNKFGFGPIAEADLSKTRRREVGPMGVAVREAASSLNDSTESLIEQRRQNAAESKEFRKAQFEGRVLSNVGLADVGVDDLPRDRLDLDSVSNSVEMEELKASIRERGQKEPIEIYLSENGTYQLKKGWRRLAALRQLFEETGDERFSQVIARVAPPGEERIELYIDMVEENVIREDLTFAEMAQVAITAASDSALEDAEADALVGRLYGSLHKMKRSYIRSFVFLLEVLGDALRFPKTVSRNVGVEVARKLKEVPDLAESLKIRLAGVASGDEQSQVLLEFISVTPSKAGSVGRAGAKPKSVKYEFHVGDAKVTARKGECRILSNVDFSSVDRARLTRAIEAFESVLKEA
ncbi:MAG: ParB N-terminal domain-containing protein [Verrucomicrobia bacterium]|nr:ParB N-terminal domain-containing protein [Verrucomicrobiota bacterium]